MTSWGQDTIAQTHAHMTSICSFVSGSETSPTLLKLTRFSAEISGFSADFHRKSLDIVKQHPNNAEIWLIACFSPVVKVEWVNISLKGTGSQKLGVGKWKKIGVLAIQKVAKTGNIGKKNSSGRQYRLCKIPQHAELSVTMREMTQD